LPLANMTPRQRQYRCPRETPWLDGDVRDRRRLVVLAATVTSLLLSRYIHPATAVSGKTALRRKTGREALRSFLVRVLVEEQACALGHESRILLGNVVTRIGRHDR